MDNKQLSEEMAGPILMILVSKFSMENSPGPHVFKFLIFPQRGPPRPLEVGKLEGSFQSQCPKVRYQLAEKNRCQ